MWMKSNVAIFAACVLVVLGGCLNPKDDSSKKIEIKPKSGSSDASRNDLNKAANDLADQSNKLNSALEDLLTLKRTVEEQINDLKNKGSLTVAEREKLVELEKTLQDLKTEEERLRNEIARIDGEIIEIKQRIDTLEEKVSEQANVPLEQGKASESLTPKEQSGANQSSIAFINFCNGMFEDTMQAAEITDINDTISALKSQYQLNDCQMLYKKLGTLTSINLDYKSIRSVRPFADFTHFKTMSFAGNKINDIRGLFNMISLEILILDGNNISYISNIPSESFPLLRSLSIKSNALSSIKGIESLKLTDLNFSNNNVSDITPLQSMTSLISLDISNNSIKSFSPLENLLNLKIFKPDSNQVGTAEYPWSEHCPVTNGTMYKDWGPNVSAVVSDFCISKISL